MREAKGSLGVLVIGGGSGIGAALCEQFKKRGDRVVVASRSNTEITCDVRDPEAIRRTIFLAKASLGKIDLLINMGAANQSKHGKLRDTTEQEIKEMVDTNVLGTLHVAREAALLLEPGAQVVLCGDAGTTRQERSFFLVVFLFVSHATNSERRTVGYATLAYTKSGLRQLAKTMFEENKDKEIGFHLIVPGLAVTDFLHVEAQPKRAWWWFNVLGEKTEVQAEYFVPKIRALKSASTPMTFEYLTTPSVMWRVATSFMRRNRFIDEQTGAVKKN